MAAITNPITIPRSTARVERRTIVPEAALQVTTTERPTRPNYVAIFVSSILAATLLFSAGVGIPAGLVYGQGAGWGLAAYCAFWMGPSFGVMTALARISAWYETNEVEY